MKKYFVLICLILLIITSTNAATISEEKTGSGLIVEGSGEVVGIEIITDGTNAVTMTLYDNDEASGKKLTPGYIISTSATNRTHFIGYRTGEKVFKTGVYVTISTDGTVTYIITYEKD
jgi:hypothetical protein